MARIHVTRATPVRRRRNGLPLVLRDSERQHREMYPPTIAELAKKRGYEVIERHIKPEELDGFTECFITGTAAEVTAVSEIANWRFTPGTITQQLMDDYTAAVQPKRQAA